jgi:hypothetical protein
MMQDGSSLEGKHLKVNEDWLLSWIRVIAQGVLLDSSVSSAFSACRA